MRASGFCPKALLVERSASVKPPASGPDGADARVSFSGSGTTGRASVPSTIGVTTVIPALPFTPSTCDGSRTTLPPTASV